ncbi:pyrroline-5-carboxylate reductase family protein [Rhodovibrionaceae bacterium A322]
MTTLGFIGAGHLADYCVRGLRRGGWQGDILLTRRNAEVSAKLASECGCEIVDDNQSLADRSDILTLATRPPQALAALADLSLRPDQTLLSVVAGLPMADLMAKAGPVGAIVRALPVTSAEFSASATLMYPPNPAVEALFNHCGQAIAVNTEEEFDAGGVLSCIYAGFFALQDQLAAKTTAAGLPAETARALVTAMAKGATVVANEDQSKSLGRITSQIATDGTFSKKVVDHLHSQSAFGPWEEAFDFTLKAFQGK